MKTTPQCIILSEGMMSKILSSSPLFSSITNIHHDSNCNDPEKMLLWMISLIPIKYAKIAYLNEKERVNGILGEIFRAFAMIGIEERETLIQGNVKFGFAEKSENVDFSFGKELVKIFLPLSETEIIDEIGDTYDDKTIKVMRDENEFQILIPFEKIEFGWE